MGGREVPRKPVEEDARFQELRTYVMQVDELGAKSIASFENEIAEKRLKMQYQKSKAIIQAINSGLSIYAAAKAANVKSSLARKNIVENAERIVSEYESRGSI